MGQLGHAQGGRVGKLGRLAPWGLKIRPKRKTGIAKPFFQIPFIFSNSFESNSNLNAE
jgi:hypothetical protein